MAKLKSGLGITGTVDKLLFYKVGKAYYLRMASSLTGDRIKKEKAFRKTIIEARFMAKASKLASALYQSLPTTKRGHALFRELVSTCRKCLIQGLTPTKIKVLVKKDFPVFRYLRSVRKSPARKTPARCIPLNAGFAVA